MRSIFGADGPLATGSFDMGEGGEVQEKRMQKEFGGGRFLEGEAGLEDEGDKDPQSAKEPKKRR
jgi:hypothetical protein